VAARRMSLKILVAAGAIGAGLFLRMRHQQTGHLRLVDGVIAGSILALSVLGVFASRFRTTEGWDDSEDSAGSDDSHPLIGGQIRWLVVVLLLPLLLWIVYSNDDLMDLWKQPAERAQTKALIEALKSPRTIQTLAGEPDETGWVPAHSDAGGFFIHVPDRFNEAIVALKLECRETPVVVVGARTEDLKFVALAASWTGGPKNLKGRIQTAAKSLCQFENPVVVREGLFEDRFPLIEMTGKTGGAKGFARIIATDKAVYGLAVEGPQLTDAMRADAARFFDSFAILAPEPNEAVILDAIGLVESNPAD
jgi:hypothetical protein